MFERLTDRARSALRLAQEEAGLLNHDFIGTEHLLLGLLREGEGVAAKALESLGVRIEIVRHRVEETIVPARLGAPRKRAGAAHSLPGPRRCWSCPCAKPSSSVTPTSARNTCCWGWCGRDTAWGCRRSTVSASRATVFERSSANCWSAI
jgi:hypothetical protein